MTLTTDYTDTHGSRIGLQPFAIQSMAHFGATLYTGPMDGGTDEMGASATTRSGKLAGLLFSLRRLDRSLHEGDLLALGKFPLGQFVLLSFLICGAFNVCVFLSVIPQAPEALHRFSFIGVLMMIALASGTFFLILPGSIVFLLFSKSRALGMRLLLLSVIYLATGTALGKAADTIRTTSFHGLAARSMSLVEAVKAFEKAEGHPPKALDDLVPKYLDSVPSTGLAAYPHYEIHMGNESSMWEDNPWVLCVPVGRGLNFDLFLYFPNQNYPSGEYSPFERFGDWGYLHE